MNVVVTGVIREPAGTLNSMTTGGKSHYYLTDATGNVLGLVDDTGKRTHTYAYGPTGLPRTTPTEAVPQPYRYAGAYADPTGLYEMGHRYYDPTLGRFTQPDPSGQETNPYLYAGGDPINNTDPSGLSLMSFASSAMKRWASQAKSWRLGSSRTRCRAGSTKRRQVPPLVSRPTKPSQQGARISPEERVLPPALSAVWQ
ncbi:hypothetical protein GCM10023323_24190 [Streptomyces thinghirensis]|uniref:Teneurin-like YD-shell domain-containing protein n=1 Tax=Streptomyces thinghirensis TaxID=551547 RepID=A0ABP9T353_9ACTN